MDRSSSWHRPNLRRRGTARSCDAAVEGHFLSLSTIAWGLSIAYLFGNLPGLGQHDGIPSVPPISIGSVALMESWQIYYLIWAFVIAAVILAYNLLNSRVGRAMRALRGGDTLVESLGINAFWIKLVSFTVSALPAAVSGWLYAHLSRFVSPASFEAGMSIEYLMMAMIGGHGSVIGAIVGAATVTLMKNSIQDYLPLLVKGASGQIEIVVFAALFIIFLQCARQSILPLYESLCQRPCQRCRQRQRRCRAGRNRRRAPCCSRPIKSNDVSADLSPSIR